MSPHTAEIRVSRSAFFASRTSCDRKGFARSSAKTRPPVATANARVCRPGPHPMSRIRGEGGSPSSAASARSVDGSLPGPCWWSSPFSVHQISAALIFSTIASRLEASACVDAVGCRVGDVSAGQPGNPTVIPPSTTISAPVI
jgi:hypothetical protein